MRKEEVKEFVKRSWQRFKEAIKTEPLIESIKGSIRLAKLDVVDEIAKKALKEPNFHTSAFGAKILMNLDVIREKDGINYRIMLFIHKTEPTHYVFIDEGKIKLIVAIPFQRFASEVLNMVIKELKIKGDKVKEGLIRKEKDYLVFYGGTGEFLPANHREVAELIKSLGLNARSKDKGLNRIYNFKING